MLKANSLVSPANHSKKFRRNQGYSLSQRLQPCAIGQNVTQTVIVNHSIPLGRAVVELKQNAQSYIERGRRKAKPLKTRANELCKSNEKMARLVCKDQKLHVGCLQPTKTVACRKISIDLDQMIVLKKKQQQSNADTKDATLRQTSPSIAQVTRYSGQNRHLQSKTQCKSASQSRKRSLLHRSQSKDESPLARRRRPSKDIRESLMGKSTNQNNICLFDIKSSQKQAHDTSAPLIADSIVSEEQVLAALYSKLTGNNLPYENWLNYLNFNFSALSMEQLQFIGILFERVEPSYLNAMDFTSFKYKAQRKCPMELAELVNHYRY